MAEDKIVDARGLSCPQPPLLARQALQKLDRGHLTIIVDNETSRENVTRTARNLGWDVETDKRSEDDIRLVMNK